MGARPQIPERMRDRNSTRFWWILLFFVLTVAAAAATVRVAAAATNSDPVAKDNSYRVHRGEILRRSAPGVLGNDSDPDGDRLSAARATSPRHGKLVLRDNGSFVYTPNERYRGMDSFTYRASDGNGGTDTATVEITVWPTIKPVLARNDSYQMLEDGTLSRQAPGVLSNDGEVGGRKLSATKVSGPAHGTLSLSLNGSFDYTPDQNFNGEDSFVYKAEDRTGRTDKATVSISVGPVNDPPAFTNAASNTSQTIYEGSGLAALQATDVDGGALTFELTGGSLPSVITLGNDGTFSGNAGSRSAGNYTADIKVSDGNGGDATTTLETTVNPVDESPVAAADTVSTDEDTAKTLTLSATDADSDNLTFDVSSPDHGSLGTVSAPNCSTTAGTATCTATVEYTPAADYNGQDSFTYTANDGNSDSDAATVNITVNPVNDVPQASPGSRTTNEDTPLSLDLGALAADVETGDADLAYEIVTQPAHGTATATTYTPDTDYNGTDSLTYKVTDRGDPDNCASAPCDGAKTSTTETVSIAVDPVNDTPVVTDANRTTDEDTPLSLDLAALASDVETSDANLTYTVTQPGNGTVTGSGASRTYTPDADYNGTDSFTYTVQDRGDPDNCTSAPCDDTNSATGTIMFTVGAVNDAPSFDLGPDQTVVNTAGAQTVSGFATNILAGPPDESGQALTFTVTNDDNSLFSVQPDIDEASGDLTFTPDSNASGTATVTVELKDDGGTANGGQDTTTKTFKITVKPPNEPPTVDLNGNGPGIDTTASFTEDGGPSTLAPSTTVSDTDNTNLNSAEIKLTNHPDGTAESLSVNTGATSITASSYDSSTGILTLSGTDTLANYQQVLCTVKYDNSSNTPDTSNRLVTFKVNDGQADSQTTTATVSVAATNDAPVLANIESDALSYTENDPATAITSTSTVSDVDSANFDTGTLTVDYTTGGTTDDRLEIRDEGTRAGQIGVSGSNVTYGGTTIGSFTGGTGTTPLVVTLDANSTEGATQALVRNITYRNVSDNPSTANRIVRFVLTDGDGGTSAPVSRNVSVTAVNDPPALATIGSGALGYTENDPATSLTSALTVTDPDSNITGATVTIGTNLAPSEDALSFANQLGITGSYNAATGVLTLIGNASAADYQTALRAVKYSNSSENPSTLTRNVTFQVKDGPAAGNLSNTQSRDVTVTAVNDAPVADDETFNGTNSAVGNTTFVVNDQDDPAPATPDPTDTSPVTDRPHKTINGDILAGDTDVDGPAPLTVTTGTFATNDGGTVTIQSDGDFTFEPSPSTSCTDTSDFFDYTINDGGSPNQTDTGRVTVAISGCVWYVNNDDAQGNSGTSEKPFDTLAQAETASGTNHSIFVYDGNNTTSGYNSGINLKSGQKLIGEAASLIVGSDTLHTADAANKPTITDNNADVVDLDDGNEVRGLQLDPQGTGGGIAGAAGDTGGGTIDDVNIVDNGTAGTQPGLELDSTTGTFNISNLTVSTSGATGVRLNNAGTTNFAPTGTISITASGAKGLDAAGTNMGSASVFDDITVTGSGSGGVSMSGTTGATSFGDGTGTDLALTTTSGSNPAFSLSNAGTVSVPSGGTANVSATGGPAIDVTGTSGASLPFDDVDSTNSSGDGINLDGLGAGTFSATSGDIGGATGIAFDLNGGSGNITYPGAIGNGSGASAEITNRTGGTATLSGAITDTNDAGGGITLTSNTGATMNFSGGLTLSTGASPALDATGGGTLNVTGSNNTIDSTTTGTALNVANTTIGSSGLNFKSISAGPASGTGPANGIVLNNTGTSGGLTVTGDSGSSNNSSGGTIQHTSGDGISLSSTKNPSFDQMNIHDTAGSGVRGDNAVNDFTFTNGSMNNNGSASGPSGGNQASSIAFNDPTGSATNAKVTGTVTITGNTLTNALWHGVSILQFAGTLDDVNISNNTLTSGTTTGTGGNSFGSGIQLFVGGEASSVASVTRAELNGNTITNFPGGVLMALQGGTSNGTGPEGTFGTPGSATNDIEVKNNILNGGGTTPDGAGGVIKPNQLILATVNGRGQGQFTIQNNGTVADPMSGSAGNIIDISAGGDVTAQATVTGNQIDAAGQSVSGTSGIAAGVGSFDVTGLGTLGDATLYSTVQNNVIKNSAGSGIRLNVNNGTPILNAIVTGNSVGAPLSATYGIQVVQGTPVPQVPKVTNLQISGNASTGSSGGGNTFPGIGLRKQGTTLDTPDGPEFGIVGLSPSPATNAQMESNVSSQNPDSTSGTFGTGGTAAINGSSSNWKAIGSVPQPASLP